MVPMVAIRNIVGDVMYLKLRHSCECQNLLHDIGFMGQKDVM